MESFFLFPPFLELRQPHYNQKVGMSNLFLLNKCQNLVVYKNHLCYSQVPV